jgi:hypothetical protein
MCSCYSYCIRENIRRERKGIVLDSELIREICVSLIYHGRNFSKTRDEIVLKKSIDAILSMEEK